MAESSNFALLREHDPVLFQLAITAERVLTSDSSTALIKLHQRREALAQDSATIKYPRESHHQTGRRITARHGADDLQTGGSQADPGLKLCGSWQLSHLNIDVWIKQQSMEGLETRRDQDGGVTSQPNNGERN